jgi:hypothetical protein
MNLEAILLRYQKKILNDFGNLGFLELINYVEMVKNICLSRLDNLEAIDLAYKQLQTLVNENNHKSTITSHMKELWKAETPFQVRIRSVCLLEYTSP